MDECLDAFLGGGISNRACCGSDCAANPGAAGGEGIVRLARVNISSGSLFEKKAGYSRAVVQRTNEGTWCFVAGTTGYNYETMAMPESVGEQIRNIIATISTVLADAGLALTDVVRANYIITDQNHKDEAFAALGESFGDIRPAATMIVAGLIEPEMKIEIEVTAFRPKGADG